MSLAPAPGVLVEVLDGEAVLLVLPSRLLIRLDQVATAVWELLASGTAPASAAEVLAQRYAAALDRVRDDVDALVVRLIADGLLVAA